MGCLPIVLALFAGLAVANGDYGLATFLGLIFVGFFLARSK